ncbi:TIR-like protein FxsC [Streptomyces sp. NBC_01136]|uniref:TIR-like protein FxsC n=1 Tax=unclassified Streptomyces TaxID=2593676 RepID=UPI003251C197|nr:TIR-like protein FxsC [Streptomyces sp. NBC_01136]
MPDRDTDNRPYFFLSYAHTPAWGPDGGDPDHWVHTFFTALCDRVTALTDLPAGAPAGFMDRQTRPGDGWPKRLRENLATCRVFVPLFSPRYFTSESCGREWSAFHERRVWARATGSGTVPVLWTHIAEDRLPDSVRHLHVDHSVFGVRYAAGGIYGLIKLDRLHDEYEETVLGLARRIVRIAHESPVPPGRLPSYEHTPSAFTPRDQGPPRLDAGPRHIHLTVAAPTRQSIPEHRDARPYGEDARDWNPYHSESARPLSALAEELIRSLDYLITVSSFDDEGTREGGGKNGDEDTGEGKGGDTGGDSGRDGGEDRAGNTAGDMGWGSGGSPAAGDPDKAPPDHPRILLVDRWALTDETRRRRLAAFDAGARPWVGVIVPWNQADTQCHGDEGRRLTAELERTLPLILDRGRRTDCRVAVNGVPTLKAFTDVLPAVVAHATRQYLKHAEAHPPPGPPTPRPRLTGPTHSPYRAGGADPGGEA